MDGRGKHSKDVSSSQSIIRNGRPSKNMAHGGGGRQNANVDIPGRVLRDIAKFAGRNAVIKLKSKDDYEAVKARFSFNPEWEIIHEPGLGHYVMVYPGACCSQ